MFKRSFVAIAALVLVCAPFFSAQSPQPSGAKDLPLGPMQAKTHTACTACHDNRIITQQRLNKEAWGKEVDKMVRWGTIMDPKDREAMIDYLSTNFPPEKPTEASPKVGKGK